ncbi:hypothetical protein STANM309S_00184 [Streptomyces tanashiensis]
MTAGSALPLGLSRSVRVTVSFTPAGSGTVAEILPVTVSFLARGADAGALTVRVGTFSAGWVRGLTV